MSAPKLYMHQPEPGDWGHYGRPYACRYDEQQDRGFMRFEGRALDRDELLSIFQATNAHFQNEPLFERSGTTATLAQISPSGLLTVVHVGDSPVNVYYRDMQSGTIVDYLKLAGFHTTHNPGEMARIKREGGYLLHVGKNKKPRLNGKINLTRAFGDKDIGAGFSHEPTIGMTDLNPYFERGMQLVVTADTDGSFERGYVPEIHVQRGDALNKSLQYDEDLAEALARVAIDNGSEDNITSLVVHMERAPATTLTVAVFDGHGEHGEEAARTASQIFSDRLEHLNAHQYGFTGGIYTPPATDTPPRRATAPINPAWKPPSNH